MLKNRKFNSAINLLLQLTVWMCAALNSAKAESLHGKFFDGRTYSGEYAISDGRNEDGMRVNPVVLKVKIGEEKDVLSYTYVADDLPSVMASNLGFLLIVVNSGGMEGSVTYNYVVPRRGALVSIGTVQTTLHLGRIEDITARPNADLSRGEINQFIGEIVKSNPHELSDSINAYPVATLLLLGAGKFLTRDEGKNLSVIAENNEISNDPFLLSVLKRVLGRSVNDDVNTQLKSDAIIIANRAYLFTSPASSSIGGSYLIKGDVVSLIRKSKDGQYWLVNYVSGLGTRTEKWLRCKDINYCD